MAEQHGDALKNAVVCYAPRNMIRLAQNASVKERQEVLRDFFRDWYGDLREGAEWQAPNGCPALLIWWHSLVLANPSLAGAQNHFGVPELKTIDPFVRYRGKSVEAQEPRQLWFFYTENQGVVTWACESGEDPVVWAKCDWPPMGSDSWSPETERLSGFLLSAVLIEAMYGAEAGGAWTSMKHDDFKSISGLEKLGLEPSSRPNQPFEFWRTNDFIAVTSSGEWTGDISVMFGSKSADALADIGDLVEDPYAAGLWQ